MLFLDNCLDLTNAREEEESDGMHVFLRVDRGKEALTWLVDRLFDFID